MHNKPKLTLIVETKALMGDLSPETAAVKAAAADFISHLERHFTAEIIWLGDLPGVCGRQLWPLDDVLPAITKNTVVIANLPILTETARNNDALLVTVNNVLSDGAAFNLGTIDSLAFLQKLLTPLNSGKIPNELLGGVLSEIQNDDPALLINPGIGEDTAAIDVADTEILVLKADPITLASNAVSRYAVLVNANDIATAGGKPRWFMTTLLFPRHTTGLAVRHIILELSQYCRKWDIVLAGGHTEITDAVTRPVISGMMSGTVTRDKLLHKKNIAAGDVMLLTKAVAVEGTALIAKEMAAQLLQGGMTPAEIDTCAKFLDMIGILPEAEIAMGHPGVVAMHDVTEGGLATAALEMAIAAGLGLSVDMDAVPVYPETQKLCGILGLDPLGLISSGCLLIACKPASAEGLIAKLTAAGIKATAIAVFTKTHPGEAAPLKDGQSWPAFAVDEIARLTQNDATNC